MTSSNIKNAIRDLMKSLIKELLFGESKTKEAEEKNRLLVFKTAETGVVETAMSLRSIQMLPYPSETKLEMDAPVLEEGCHVSVSQLIDKNMIGSLINNQSKKQEMLNK